MSVDKKFQVVVLAGGKGTRMGGLDVPKVLFELAGEPLLSYILKNVRMLELAEKTIVVVGYKHELVEQKFGTDYIYVLQEQQLGTAHAVMAAQRLVTAPNVLVVYGDMPFMHAESLEKLVSSHLELGAKLSMITVRPLNFDGAYSSLLHYGRVIRNSENGEIEASIEYRDCTPEQKLITELNPCFYSFQSSWLWQRIKNLSNKNAQGEYYLTDLVHVAIEEGEKINTVPIAAEEVIGVNSSQDLEYAQKLIN